MGSDNHAGDRRKALVHLALMLIAILSQDDLVDLALPLPDKTGAELERRRASV